MTMQDLEGKRVVISARTITVKDEQGKTRGLVRDARPFRSWTDRERFDHREAVCRSGLFSRRDGAVDRCILYSGKLYFLNDTRKLDFYAKMYAGDRGEELKRDYPHEWERYQDLLTLPERVKDYMTVINCEIIN